MRRLFLAALTSALLLVSLVAPASAITNGQPDGDLHDNVGQLLFYDPTATDPRFNTPGGWFNCSGTLLSPTVLLTAGHCTFGIGENGAVNADGVGGTDIWLNLNEKPNYNILPPSSGFAPGNNAGRYTAWSTILDASADWVSGTAYPHTNYNDGAFFLFDVGIVVLDEAVAVPDAGFGTLPTVGQLDTLSKPKGQTRFTAVGYGLNLVRPWGAFGGDERQYAELMLVNLNGVFGLKNGIAAVFSNNNGAAHQGGTCFGDSGGPIFVADTNTVIAVTSFGVSPNCTGNGGGYRIDQVDDLTFINSFLD